MMIVRIAAAEGPPEDPPGALPLAGLRAVTFACQGPCPPAHSDTQRLLECEPEARLRKARRPRLAGSVPVTHSGHQRLQISELPVADQIRL